MRRLFVVGGVLLLLSLLLALWLDGRPVGFDDRVELALGGWLGRAALVLGAGCITAGLVLRGLRPARAEPAAVNWYG